MSHSRLDAVPRLVAAPGATSDKRLYVSHSPALLQTVRMLAQTQHLNHKPQTACNTLSSNELWRGDLIGHRESLIGVI